MRHARLLPALLIAGCAAGEPLPPIPYDAADFTQAQRTEAPPRPVEIVRLPEPLPLPGQLKPLAVGGEHMATDAPASPEDRVEAANEAARMAPEEAGYVNAVQVYPFTEGALYRLYAAPGQVSDIALQPGEAIVSLAAGDTVRWIVGETTSGTGASARAHVLVKPMRAGLASNLVILTDRRAYHLEMESTEATYMAALSWSYPHDELRALARRNARAEEAEARVIEGGLALDELHFRYRVSGDEPPWRPLRAFDDGAKVYIQFPARLDQGEAPPLFVVGPTGEAELVNYRVKGRYYIVDRLFAAAELRLGEAPQQVVRIHRAGGGEDGR